MGLSAPKRRTKLSADPNNTSWTRDTTTFGHRMLTAQGWTPGQFLGATDAAHAAHYSAANASHVRVLLRDDNLGLGAKKGREGAETFGLDMFAGLLGRLNGKGEGELKEEAGRRRDVRLRMWQEGRGGMRFVSAGFLVGGEVREKPAEETPLSSSKGKKRVATGEIKQNVLVEEAASAQDEERAMKKKRKEARRQRETEAESETPAEVAVETAPRSAGESKTEKQARKEAKRARKAAREERRQRKEAKRKARLADKSEATSTAVTATTTADDESPALVAARPNVRRRYIQQKRMAGMDPKALREIFMIKGSA